MPLGNWNLQWVNHNSQRSYPLVDWGSAKDQTGTIKIPDSFILALDFPIHSGLAVQPEKFFIKTITIYPNGISVTMGYDDGGSLPVVASINIDANGHTENTPYALAGSGDFADSVGKMVIGPLDAIQQLPTGLYTFDPESTTIETDAIRPMLRAISSLVVVNGSDRSEPIYGDIELVAGDNMRIVANQISGRSPQILFSAIAGAGLNEECACDEDSATGDPIRFINGIPPLPDGNFKIIGNNCIEIQPVINGIQINDLCSEPCCGCEELEAIIRQIDRFSDGVTTLERFTSTLNAEVIQMRNVVLGSRISDDGCTNC